MRSMRVTFTMLPPPPHPNGHYQTHYIYANELASFGHDVTIMHWVPPKLEGRKCIPTMDKIVERVKSDDFWFRFNPEVHHVACIPKGPKDIPEGDAVFEVINLTMDELYPKELGVNFAFGNGYAEVTSEAKQFDIWFYGGWKIMIARWLRELAVEKGIPRWELEHVSNGVDGNLFQCIKPIEERPRRIAFHLDNLPIKGGKIGIEALKLVRDARPDVEVRAFGRRKPDELPDWVDHRQTPSRAELVTEIYNEASIFLCPGVREALNNPSQEAMSCGCAVVGTTMGGLTEFAEHEGNALLCPVKDPRGLADNAIRLLDDPEERIRLAKAGRETAAQRTWRRSAKKLEWVLETRLEASLRAGTDPRRAAIEGKGRDELEAALAEVLQEREGPPA